MQYQMFIFLGMFQGLLVFLQNKGFVLQHPTTPAGMK